MIGVRCTPAQVSQRPVAATAQQLRMRRRLGVAKAEEKPSSSSTTASTSEPAPEQGPPEPVFKRTFKSLGSEVIEQNTDFEEPPAKDFWENESYEAVGTLMEKYFLPFLVVLGLVCGAYAANTYNEDADVFIKPSSGPDQLPTVVPAAAFQEAQQAPPV